MKSRKQRVFQHIPKRSQSELARRVIVLLISLIRVRVTFFSTCKPMVCGDELMSGMDDSVVVLWTSGDRDVALNMVFMYTLNAKRRNWWKDVRLIVWGPSSRLLSEDEDLQDEIWKLGEAGVILEACKACADRYGVSEDLEQLGIDVKYMGVPLTEYLKEGRSVLSL